MHILSLLLVAMLPLRYGLYSSIRKKLLSSRFPVKQQCCNHIVESRAFASKVRYLQLISPKSGWQGNDKKICNIELSNDENTLFELFQHAANQSNTGTTVRIAGGWVRDKLLSRTSKDDVDVAVDNMSGCEFALLARDAVENNRSVNGNEEFESVNIGIIQQNPDKSKHLETDNSRIPEVCIGTPEEDSFRRDLTINSLFYNIHTKEVEDYTNRGLSDLRSGIVRTPLPALVTLTDDPLRALRAVRFACRFQFSMSDELAKACADPAVHSIISTKVSNERKMSELTLMLNHPTAIRAMSLLYFYGLTPSIFEIPSTIRIYRVRSPQDTFNSTIPITSSQPIIDELIEVKHTTLYSSTTSNDDAISDVGGTSDSYSGSGSNSYSGSNSHSDNDNNSNNRSPSSSSTTTSISSTSAFTANAHGLGYANILCVQHIIKYLSSSGPSLYASDYDIEPKDTEQSTIVSKGITEAINKYSETSLQLSGDHWRLMILAAFSSPYQQHYCDPSISPASERNNQLPNSKPQKKQQRKMSLLNDFIFSHSLKTKNKDVDAINTLHKNSRPIQALLRKITEYQQLHPQEQQYSTSSSSNNGHPSALSLPSSYVEWIGTMTSNKGGSAYGPISRLELGLTLREAGSWFPYVLVLASAQLLQQQLLETMWNNKNIRNDGDNSNFSSLGSFNIEQYEAELIDILVTRLAVSVGILPADIIATIQENNINNTHNVYDSDYNSVIQQHVEDIYKSIVFLLQAVEALQLKSLTSSSTPLAPPRLTGTDLKKMFPSLPGPEIGNMIQLIIRWELCYPEKSTEDLKSFLLQHHQNSKKDKRND